MMSLRHGLRDTHIAAQFDQLKMVWKIGEFLFVIVQQCPCTLSLVRGDLFVVDNSVGITMVSELF